MSNKRPEYLGPPEEFYCEKEARKYTSNSHIIKIQNELSARAYQLLELPKGSEGGILLDIGCGSGLSGEVLTENGHEWIGVDISEHMLRVARVENECEGELVLKDIGAGLPFRPGTFDGAISISALQWLCHSNSTADNPYRRLHTFFQSLYACLARGARAVFQFYPENRDQCKLLTDQALKVGFQGGLVVDHPVSPRLRKIFLVIVAGGLMLQPHNLPLNISNTRRTRNPPEAEADEPDDEEEELSSESESDEEEGNETMEVDGDEGTEERHESVEQQSKWKRTTVETVSRNSQIRKAKNCRKRPQKGSRAWIEAKRERQLRKGLEVRPLSKYSGRIRKKGNKKGKRKRRQ